MQLKALAILGSPRKNKNTDILLNKAIEGLIENEVQVEKIELRNEKIDHCIGCDACAKTGICFIKDDMSKLYSKFDEADIVIIATPLYFNSVSSITKTMIDRCQAFWASKYVLNKSSIDRNKRRRGLFICTAGSELKRDGFIGAEVVIDLFFRAINTQNSERLLVDQTDKIMVKDRQDILNEAYEIGKKLSD
ncbi:flavodoxin family protein [Lutibacter sp. B2]|nr:flavodoxin family protein [Lutibacter sp. B2]